MVHTNEDASHTATPTSKGKALAHLGGASRFSLLALVALGAFGCDVHAPPGAAESSFKALVRPIDLTVTDLVPGAVTRITVGNLAAGESTTILRSSSVQPGPCPAVVGGLCLDIGPAVKVLGSAVADGDGVAILDLSVPGSLPLGRDVALQAVAVRGPGGADSVASGPVAKVTGGLPCGNAVLDPGEVCDDGNLIDGDGCSSTCSPDVCMVPDVPVDERVHDFVDHINFGGGGLVVLENGDLLTSFPMKAGSDEYTGLGILSGADLSLVGTSAFGTSNGDELVRIVADHSGGAYVASTTDNGIGADGLVSRVDGSGALLWSTRVVDGLPSGIYDIQLSNAAVAADDSVAVVGTFSDMVSLESWGLVAVLDADGSLLHARAWRSWTLEDTENYGVVATSDGGWVVTGGSTGGVMDAGLMKLDGGGAWEWFAEQTAGTASVRLEDVLETADGGFVATGTYHELGSQTDVVVMRTDAFGQQVWMTVVENPGHYDYAVDVAQVPQTCAVDPTHGAECLTQGEQCARSAAAELCACSLDGLWSCAPGEPSFVVAAEYEDDAYDDYMLLATFSADGTLEDQTAWGAATEIHGVGGLTVGPDAGIAAVGQGFTGAHVIRTDVGLSPGCDGVQTSLETYAVVSTMGSITPTAMFETSDFTTVASGAVVQAVTATADDARCASTTCPQ